MKTCRNYITKILALISVISVCACQKAVTQPDTGSNPTDSIITYENIPQAFPLTGAIDEASGIADSKANPGYLWVEQDSGNPPMIYMMGHDGKVGKSILVDGATNRDWEDMALANGPVAGKNYLYLGDIGDNDAKYPDYTIYRFEEPDMEADKISSFDKIVFTYPDGSHDAEAFLVDATTKDIYIITKRDDKSRIYKLPYPQSTTAVNQASFISAFNYNGVVSATVSSDGNEIIVKTYTGLYYYTRKNGETIAETLQHTATTLGYRLEQQGEAVCFSNDNTGFYTLSEKATDAPVSLNFYKRK